ncbi:hypothetical protein QE429_000963 [Bacillus sp. SORGH_AS 510]|uniref:zinc ribbon domain-containing protein n=1 Tax=Bacillus sp. SORGH_AS_0510 TaxID=3041771 RepID=UPI002785D350|nr:zinc ribbon domain-containing protein [Bacillus sp. SORGH_AS_0510]MDQ1144136.1 hypothetical protein [Bacillus sp. SORGH_AS_0510]
MQCPACSHQNEGGKFCEQCGTKLVSNAFQETASAVDVEPTSNPSYQQSQVNTQPNQYLEGAKNISKMYFSYFLQVLKKPYASSKSVGSEHFINGIITMVLYSVVIPLMIYFGLKTLLSSVNEFGSMFGGEMDIQPPFTDVVIKPTFAYAVFILLVASFTFFAIKLGKVNVTYKEVISRFGSFLIPFVAILFVALIMSILKIKLFLLFLFIGFITSIFIVPPLVIASYKKESQEGLDVIYGTLFTFVLTFIAIGIMGDMLFESIKSAVTDIFSIF